MITSAASARRPAIHQHDDADRYSLTVSAGDLEGTRADQVDDAQWPGQRERDRYDDAAAEVCRSTYDRALEPATAEVAA